MSSNMADHVKRLREERVAREQARIQKLREINMKKYPKSELLINPKNQQEVKKKASAPQVKAGAVKTVQGNQINNVKTGAHAFCGNKRPVTVPVMKKPDYANSKLKVAIKIGTKSETKVEAKPNRNVSAKGKDFIAANVKKSAIKVTKNLNHKPSTSNFDLKSKPDIITESSDNATANIENADTKMTEPKNIDVKNSSKDTSSKPDLLIATEIDQATNKSATKKVLTEITKKVTIQSKLFQKNDLKSRKSYSQGSTSNYELGKPKTLARRSMLPKLVEDSKSESVFDRLYKPKVIKKTTEQKPTEAEKLRTDPNYLKKVSKNADLIYNMHQQKKSQAKYSQRRSISAVHFKRLSKSEANNCIHKWGSIGDKLDKVDLNEDVPLKDEKVTSFIKSERKKVKFLTPSLMSFNTPRPEELQSRLKMWLQKRGKSLSSYQHLNCFGLHHLKPAFGTPKSISSMAFEDAIESPRFDDENKENISLESDSDDGSYSEMMNKPEETLTPANKIDVTNWRNVSMASESLFNESNASHKFNDSTLTSAESVITMDELLEGALNDLSTLLREGFDWQQAARWLRSIRARFPGAPRSASYWECRAALEDARGNLTASLECWNEAIAKGAEESVVDSNLDQLLNKFMQLKISPQSGAARQADPKLVDVKNVFKSTIIKFAVQQAKLRTKDKTPTPMFTVTPVRRSARLSHRISRTPLRLCDTVRQAATIAPEHIFTHNDNFVHTP